MKPRTYNVLVIREDRSEAGAKIQGDYIMANSKRGSAYSLELPAYKNDVLQALSEERWPCLAWTPRTRSRSYAAASRTRAR